MHGKNPIIWSEKCREGCFWTDRGFGTRKKRWTPFHKRRGALRVTKDLTTKEHLSTTQREEKWAGA